MGLTVPREKSNRNYIEVDQRIYQALEKAERVYKQRLREMPAAVDYLKGRGLTGVTARDFGIGYAPQGWHSLSEVLLNEDVSAEVMLKAGLTIKNDSGRVYDRFRHRIMFPIRDVRGRVIGFGGRKLGDEEGPKYLNSPETPVFAKNQELYGLYEARKALRSIDRLLVVEGYMDVVALAQRGFRNAVATLGTATGEAHYQKLYRYTDEVVCCFDGDKAGRAAAWRALESALSVLNEHRQLKFVFLPDGEDPDSMVRDQGAEAFSEFLQNATPGLEYLFSKLGEGLDLQSLDGRARFMGLANPLVEKIPAGILQELVRKRVQEIGGIETGTIRAEDGKSKLRVSKRDDGRFGSVLAQRLLGMLLKAPYLWSELDKSTQAEFLAYRKELGVLGRLVSLLHAQPDLDTNEILIAWSDEGDQQRLIEFAKKPVASSAQAWRQEFLDGSTHLLRQCERSRRQKYIAQLKASGNEEKLRELLPSKSRLGDT